MKHYYNELPKNSKEFFSIDAKDSKTILWLNIVAVVMLVIVGLPFILFKPYDISSLDTFFTFLIIILPSMFMYIVLHELIHGLVYKLYTKQKLTFGFTLFVAFCGVPNIYIKKKAALVAVLAPFVFFSIILIPVILIVPANLFYLISLFIFCLHFSGCVGDFFVAYILIKSKGEVIINDTGPKQTFYILNENTNL
ncbi:MAG: DUF3267 domain-containing protein [Bacilli bacterium]